MATKDDVKLTPDEVKLVVLALATQAAVFKRAANTEKDESVKIIREASYTACLVVGMKVQNGSLL